MSDRLPLMAGNWKMNCNHLEAIALVQKLAFTLTPRDFDAVEVAVLPPFTDLRSVQTLVDGDKLRIGFGAQDLSPFPKGAYTGDISGPMLAKLRCSYVLAGHSERRQYHHEDDALVNAKVRAALANSIVPILCVGESLDVRRADGHIEFVLGQLNVAGEGARGAGRLDGDRVRAGLGDRHRRGGQPAGRASDVRRDPGADFCHPWRRNRPERAYPVWRVRQER
jgi:triosephosphate isomerase (TIM)